MKLLVLTAYPNIRGPLPKLVPWLIGGLRSVGCAVATTPWGRHSDDENLLQKTVGRARDILRVRRHAQRTRFDLVLVSTAHNWAGIARDLPLLLALRPLGPLLVLHFHGSLSNRLVTPGGMLFKRLSSWLVRLSDAVLLMSTEEQRQWQAVAPAEKFHVVRYAFPEYELPAARTLTRPERWGTLPVLLFVGRLMPEKGILDLLDAFRAVVERTGCRLMVCGSGPLEGEVRRRVAQHGLDSHVTIRGYLTGEDLVAAYRDADVFVLPTYWGEGFPTVIGEAMGAGLPIVTTRIRGVADLLEEGTNALFVPPRDPDALACALLRLTEHPSLRDRMSTANREKIKAFAPDIVARQYLQAFACIAGRSAGRHARRPPVLARPLPGKPARPSSGATGPAVHNLMDELSGGRT